jgi:hypothetical protein
MTRRVSVLVVFVVAWLAVGVSGAAAAVPWWHLSVSARPSYLAPGSVGEIAVTAEDLGDAGVDGAKLPVRITDTLPAGVEALAVAGSEPDGASATKFLPLTCSLASKAQVSCEATGALASYSQLEVRIKVKVLESAVSGEEDTVSVSGGGAPSAQIKRALTVSEAPTPFGVQEYELLNEEEGGGLATQAGAHPFQQTTTIAVNQAADVEPPENAEHKPLVLSAGGLAKDLDFKWPPGLIGDPTAFPQCTLGQFLTVINSDQENECPADSAVGVATVTIFEPILVGYGRFTVPVFNLEPLQGEPARFGFLVLTPGVTVPVFVEASLRTGSDYGITVRSQNISQAASFLSAAVTVWGVPGSASHALTRGWGCLEQARGVSEHSACSGAEEQHPAAFLSLPTSCSGPLQSTLEGDTWAQADQREDEHLPPLLSPLATSTLPALDGCNRLPFAPEVRVSTEGSGQQASRPTGLTVDVHVPQEGQLNAAGDAQSNIKDIKVTLPEGVTINASAADGLQACSQAQVGYLPGESQPPGELHFTPAIESPFCPDASKVATVTIKTPLLANPLQGAVYLAAPQNFVGFPQENPFGSLIAGYLVAEDPVSGSLVKLAGKVSLNEATGQIEATFENTPQLPFEDAEVHFFDGERAPLSTPPRCGIYNTNAMFTPWSGGEPVDSSSGFQITSGPGGSPCPAGALPFSPSFASGTLDNNAGAFSALTTTLSREDGQQNIQSLTLHYPSGIAGLISSVTPCGEAQANAGSCGPASEIGETTVSVGVGSDPFTVTGGKVYITGPYEGAPFGLSIVTPVKAGPFELQQGRPVVVRAKIEVDPRTAGLTITTDPAGSPHAIPTIIEGFPVQIKHVNVNVTRPGFTFNPTNCDPLAITGAVNGAEGASTPVSVSFQAANCATLKFTPKVTVSTTGHASKLDGTSLAFKISYPPHPLGSQAWFNEAKFDIPKQLPARLETLQRSCLSSVFERNPANCPPAATIGHATVRTPVLPVPLTGPVYFVSYGGAKFPEAVIVLQGDNVTVDLHGETYISRQSVTSATFRNTPDVPFESIEVTVPQGRYSEFGATVPAKDDYNLCGQKLTMPTLLKAQNGLHINQNTPIAITGCKKAKARKLKPSKRKATKRR